MSMTQFCTDIQVRTSRRGRLSDFHTQEVKKQLNLRIKKLSTAVWSLSYATRSLLYHYNAPGQIGLAILDQYNQQITIRGDPPPQGTNKHCTAVPALLPFQAQPLTYQVVVDRFLSRFIVRLLDLRLLECVRNVQCTDIEPAVLVITVAMIQR